MVGQERSSVATLEYAWSVFKWEKLEWYFPKLEWSFSKRAVSWRKAALTGLPLARSGVEGWGFFNSWTRSSIAAVARSVAEVVGILNFVGRKVTESELCVALVVFT